MTNDAGGTDEQRASAPPRVRSGRGLAAFAVLLALSALGLAGYPYYERFAGYTSGDTNSTIEALRVAQERQSADLQRVIENTAQFEAQSQNQRQRVDENTAQPAAAAPSPASALSPESQRALKLAQAEYLMRNANDRLLAQRDLRGALTLLLAAQSLVAQVDMQSLAAVRDGLAKDIDALRGDAGIDVAAVSARLQALSRAVTDLPARGARFTATPDAAAPGSAPQSNSELAWQKFRSLFEFRRQGAAPRPPLGPDEAAYLRLNLALQLQIAELALLRGETSIYQQSLSSVRRWLDDYLDPGAVAVTSARAEVDQLLEVRLDRALPDISGSLNALRPLLDAPVNPTPALPAEAVEDAPAAGAAEGSPTPSPAPSPTPTQANP